MKRDDVPLFARNLPAVPGIHGRDEYATSVVTVLLTERLGELHFVLEERNPRIRQGGEVCFPGGMFDPALDTSARDTALREISEELGIPRDSVDLIGRLDTLVVFMGTVVDVFVGITDRDVASFPINREEVEKVFTIPVSWFAENPPETHTALIRMVSSEIDPVTDKETVYLPVRKLGLPDRYLEPWGNFKQNVYVYKAEEGIVWGLTARIIMDFLKYSDPELARIPPIGHHGRAEEP